MTTIDQAREAVYERWRVLWAARTIWTFENEKFTEPKGAVWVRVSVRNLAGGQKSQGPKGSRKYERKAAIYLQIFVPKETGMDDSGNHAEYALGIYEGESFSGLFCFDGSVRELPDEEVWQSTLVEIFFDYEEIK
jgi:hypothetical protein